MGRELRAFATTRLASMSRDVRSYASSRWTRITVSAAKVTSSCRSSRAGIQCGRRDTAHSGAVTMTGAASSRARVLRARAAQPAPSLATVCDSAVTRLVPISAGDDIALLAARLGTRP
uniref:Uncharacterized protein n=1 Tax=Streptomyces sp. TP-A0584 TaxID=314563 RepID=A0A6S4QAS5_9ACTN|nr:hypothetical protein [Streptomyces sp. TP-A0584]